MKDLSVVIPALDEEASLPGVLSEVRDMACAADLSLELVLIDDGSWDGTPGIMAAAGADRVIRHPAPLGCHPSTLEGFRASTGKWVVFLPADGQIPPAVVPGLIREAEEKGLDVVVGVRARRMDAWHRRAIAAAYARLLRLLFGLPCRDVDSSTLYRGERLGQILPAVHSDSAAIAAEILLRMKRDGARIGEAEIPHRPRTSGRAKGVNWKDALGVPRNLARLALGRRGPDNPAHAP